jgi:hypothetical protein
VLPRYFQGSSVTGPVKASPAQSFAQVVDTLRICPVLGITRSAFLALPKRERNEAKQVPFFVPACFRSSPSKRVTTEATHCNLIFIDIDDANDAATFVNNPQALYTALAGLNFAAHTTASSTPENPRMRVIVEAEGIPLEQYADAVRTIAAMLGIVHVTTESRVAVQPMFFPTQFQDSTEDDHPLIAHRCDASAFGVDDITSGLTEEPRYRNPDNNHPDALSFLRAPVPEITLAIAKSALEHLDPDCSYLEWLAVASALKHQFSPHKAEEAYDLFDDWSSRGTKYTSADDTRAKWDSVRQTPIGRAPLTIRTLLKNATAAGWDDARVKDNCFQKLQEWMETVETATELLEYGVQRILGMPLLTNVQEGMAIDHLRKQAKSRFQTSITAVAIKKDIERLRAEIKTQEKATDKVKEPLWAKGICYISAAQEFYRHRTGEKYKPESFNASFGRKLLPTEVSLREAGLPVTPAALSRPIVAPTDYALNHLKVPIVYDYAYDPSRPTEMFFVNRGKRYVNTYSPTYPEADSSFAAEAGAIFQRHLAHLVLEAEYARTLVDFMAFMVQNPGRKVRWAAVIQGVEGCGKTYLAEVMKAVLGSEHVKTVSGDAIKSGYNEWSFGHQLVVLEEVRVMGSNRHEIMNALKPLITNDEISVNEKFRNQRNVENISNYMMFSNHHNCLSITGGDRRYFVIKSPLQTKQQVLALGENYFSALFGMLKKHPGAMRSWLLAWPISVEFMADGHAPRTKYVHELVADSANDVTAAIRRLLLEGDHPLVQYDIVSAKSISDMLALEEGISRVSAQQVAHILRDEGFTSLGRHTFGEERHYIWARGEAASNGAVETAGDRFTKGQKNLCMELLF